MYASPEVLLYEPRGRASDIFSMGCVWLEMYTVLLGESLSDFEQYRKSPADDLDDLDITDMAMDGVTSGFAQTLSNVQKWIERLIAFCSMHGSLILGGSENFPGLGVSCVKVIEGLHGVEKMLHRNPDRRPDTRALCLQLGTNKCCEENTEKLQSGDKPKSSSLARTQPALHHGNNIQIRLYIRGLTKVKEYQLAPSSKFKKGRVSCL